MTTKTNGTKAEQGKAKQNGAIGGGANEVITDATVLIPLSVVYERCKDLLGGAVPGKAQIKSDTHLGVSTRKVTSV